MHCRRSSWPVCAGHVRTVIPVRRVQTERLIEVAYRSESFEAKGEFPDQRVVVALCAVRRPKHILVRPGNRSQPGSYKSQRSEGERKR